MLNSLNNFGFLSKSKVFDSLLIIISIGIFLYLTRECFVFSANYELESWRGIDDVAFQHKLFDYFPNPFHGDLNGYGYGWLFWISNIIFSYPGYLLHLYGYDQLLIVSPRLLSLILSFAGLYFFYKILVFYSTKKWLPAIATLFLLSYPAFGFYATYFGTAAHVFFYSVLTLYFLLCKDLALWANQKKVVVALAACGAVKLTGFFILPIVTLVFLDRYFVEKKITIKMLLKLCGIFALIWILLVDPKLYLSPFNMAYLKDFLSVVKYYIHHAVAAQSSSNSWIFRINYGLIVSFLALPVFICCVVLLTLYAFLKTKKQQRDFLYIFLIYILTSVYLIFVMHGDYTYITLYSYSISWIPLLGLILLDTMPFGLLSGVFLLLLNLSVNHAYIFLNSRDDYWIAYNVASHKKKYLAPSLHLQIAMQNAILRTNSVSKNAETSILLLFPAPAAFSSFNPAYKVFYMFEESQISSQAHFDYIIVSQKSLLLSKTMPDHASSVFVENRCSIQQLIQQHVFHHDPCSLIYQQQNIKLFKCDVK